MLNRANLRRAFAALVVAALIVPAALALAHGGTDTSSVASNEPEIVTPESGQPVPKESKIDFCPTKEQSDRHWEVYGFDYKPTIPCGDAVNVDVAPHRHALGEDEPEPPSTFSEAQSLYDPSNDPNILIGKDPDSGKFYAVDVITLSPIPRTVRSIDGYKRWISESPSSESEG